MTERSYKCNLCRKTIAYEDGPNVHCRGVGFEFRSGRLERKPLSQCENHICLVCAEHTASFWAEIKPWVATGEGGE